MRILVSTETSAVFHAALEEWLFRQPSDGEPTLLVYSNGPAVLFGRNQNPWAECDVAYCREAGVPLVRRLSGGGTVYHDLGNVNMALIAPRALYDPAGFAACVCDGLAALGCEGLSCDSHHSVFCRERKLCGTAFALAGGTALMHGCLLVTTDLTRLWRALAVPADSDAVPGVRSNRVPVTRLADEVAGMTPDDAAAALMDAAQECWGEGEPCTIGADDVADQPQFAEYSRKYADDSWTFRQNAGQQK